MTVAVDQQEKEEMASFGSEINNVNPSDYSCQILLEKTTLEEANDKTFPNDARLIWYIVDGVEYIDLTRCKKTSGCLLYTSPSPRDQRGSRMPSSA